jgi:hypothetical protein
MPSVYVATVIVVNTAFYRKNWIDTTGNRMSYCPQNRVVCWNVFHWGSYTLCTETTDVQILCSTFKPADSQMKTEGTLSHNLESFPMDDVYPHRRENLRSHIFESPEELMIYDVHCFWDRNYRHLIHVLDKLHQVLITKVYHTSFAQEITLGADHRSLWHIIPEFTSRTCYKPSAQDIKSAALS